MRTQSRRDERPAALQGALWALVALALALVVIHLWPDESPVPETRIFQSLLDPPSTPESWFHGANGFLAEGDIFASGERFAAGFRQSGTAMREEHLVVPEELLACMRTTPGCPDALPREKVRDLLASHRTLLDHYLALYGASDFANVLPAELDAPLPHVAGILAAQQLLLASLLAETDTGNALHGVDQDLAYWRRVLAGTNVLLTKVAAVRGASRALMLRSRLMERLDATALRSLPQVPTLLPVEWDMQDAIRFEMGIDYPVIHDLGKFMARNRGLFQGLYALLPIKPNATYNRHQQNHAPFLAMAGLPAPDFVNAHATRPPALHAVGWWDRIFNGKGIWILRMADATQVFGKYTFIAHDLDAQIALVNLKQQMLGAGSDAGSWRQQLAASPIRNPYRNEERGQWDESESQLGFETRPGPESLERLPLKVSFPGELP